MACDFAFSLTSISVVVTANNHNPSILTPEFLVSQGIVPPDWEVLDSMTTPGFSAVNYKERLQWILDQGALRIIESCEGAFRDSYEVHELATRYIDRVRVVPYRSLGLNCQICLLIEDSEQWITKRFLSTDVQSQNIRDLNLEPRFLFSASPIIPGAIINLSVRSGEVASSDEEWNDAAIIDCNVHHQGPLEADSLISAIDQWTTHQDSIRSALGVLFGGDQ